MEHSQCMKYGQIKHKNQVYSSPEYDEEEAKFVRKIKRELEISKVSFLSSALNVEE